MEDEEWNSPTSSKRAKKENCIIHCSDDNGKLVFLTEKAYRYVQQKNIIIYQTCPRKKPSFWSNIKLSQRRKGRLIFSSGIGKG